MSKQTRSERRALKRRERAAKRAAAEARAARRAGLLPVVGGVIIDVADVVSLGGLGGVGGAMIGALITYGVCSQTQMSRLRTMGLTMAGAIYCALPFTEALPLATLLALVTSFASRPAALPPASEPAMEPVSVTQVGTDVAT